MRRKAFGIAETLLASAIIAMVLIGLYGISSTTSRSSQAQKDRVTAVALAEDTIETVRANREMYWRGLAGGTQPGRSATGFWDFIGSPGGSLVGGEWVWSSWVSSSDVTGFTRRLVIAKAPTNDIAGKLSYTSDTGQPVTFDAPKAVEAASSLLKVTVTVNWTTPSGPQNYSLTTYLTDWLEGML